MTKKIIDTKKFSTITEMLASIEAEKKAQTIFRKIREFLYYEVWCGIILHYFIDPISDTPRNIKSFIQRGRRGWAEEDTWGLDDYLAKVIADSVEYLASYAHGYPSESKSLKNWKHILKTIAFTFKTMSYRDYKILLPTYNDTWATYQKKYKDNKKLVKDSTLSSLNKKDFEKYQQGWILFQQYFFALWD